ncbi:MAG: bifunctional (p)ppGpp synthetase/guanosine-3',5'-bis(diphosphate) 3'-pyrophosphohydrolase [Caulobacterales bacterium]
MSDGRAIEAAEPPGLADAASKSSEKIAKPPRGKVVRQVELLERIRAYDPSADEGLINRAYVFTMMRHGDQRRHSGDPYFAHPIEVAAILTDLKLDVETIVAGLLHDTIEDTETTRGEVAEKFGEGIAALVDGVTKLSQLELASPDSKQAENLQKFILASSRDVRVLLVKLADRLHNMRTLRYVPKPERRQRIARETLEIYAPLARRIGVVRICEELEDLAFAELDPSAAQTIAENLEKLRKEKGNAVDEVARAIGQKLEDAGIKASVFGRQKRPYSIWRKLERKSVAFHSLSDIYGFRVIVQNDVDCYRALGVIHSVWRCVPDRFADYISTPKPNGYRSIHTSVMGPKNLRIELQIRTEEMDQIAERGVAAHWRYKNHSYGYDAEAASAAGADPLESLRGLIEILDHGGEPEEFLEHAKMEMFQDQVFAFTPKGDIIPLPRGATPLDFAYAVHTEVGETCIGARINGVDRPLRTRLKNGDIIEIIRSRSPTAPADWESMAVTGRARSALRRLVRTRRREELIRVGRTFADHALHRVGHSLEDTDLDGAARKLRYEDEADLFIAMASGIVDARKLAEAAYPGLAGKLPVKGERIPIEEGKAMLYVRGSGLTPGVSLHFSPCCSPIPGDRIVGRVSPGRGVDVHTIDCEVLGETDAATWIDLSWTEEAKAHALAVGRIVATVENVKGALARLCSIASEHDANLTNIKTINRSPDFFDVVMDIEVADSRHLSHISAAMRACPFVVSVDRPRG